MESSNGGSDRPGQDWMLKYLEAFALVEAESLMLTFKLGQAGVAMHFDKAAAKGAVAELGVDVGDLESACDKLVAAAKDILANAQRNVRG